MTIYLHIGNPKTGTTTLQWFFAHNRRELRRLGYRYSRAPGRFNHRKLALYAKDPNKVDKFHRSAGLHSVRDVAVFREKFRRRFLRELKTCLEKDIILSNEHCSARLQSNEEIARLRDLLREVDDDIKVIIYLRDQTDYYFSLFSTRVKGGATEPLDYSAATMGKTRYDYDKLLRKWRKVFGGANVIVRLFAKDELAQQDLITDMLRQVGIKKRSKLRRIETKNTSLDVHTVEYLRYYNKIWKQLNRYFGTKRSKNLADHLELISWGPKIVPTDNVRQQIMARFNQSNAAVARRYFARPGGVLFAQKPGRSSTGRAPSLTLWKAVEITYLLFRVRRVLPHHEISNFPEKAYLIRHPDIAAMVKTGRFACGLDHFLRRGFAEGRVLPEPEASRPKRRRNRRSTKARHRRAVESEKTRQVKVGGDAL